ncbi:MAG: DNA-binding transcriptional ArsR family regulator [Natronomonas sp.]
MTDEIPPERQCPVCGELNVNPHPDSLCPEHHPAEDLDVTPLEDTTKPTPDPTLAEVRAVAEQEATPDRDRQDDVVDDLSPTATPDQPATDAGDDSGSFLAAALGDPDATEAHGSDDTDVQDTTPSSAGGVGMPTGALPLGQLDALDPRERRRAAKKRGLDWPTTDEARDRLEETVHDVLRHEDDRVIDAPTSLGKTHTVASTRWGAREDLTGSRPVVHLLETRDARDEALEIAEEHGGEYLALESRHEACPLAAGDYDPQSDDDADDESDHEPITIDGQPASEWLQEVCDDRGVHFSAAHRHLEEHNDQGRDLPCHEDGDECDAIAQWEKYREGPDGAREYWPLVIATHNFAYEPGIRMANNVVIDEEPDFLQDLSTDRLRRAVGAYLRHIDATVQTWEAFVQLTRYDGYRDDAANERKALESDLQIEPDREWYFQEPDAHMLAPALARAIFHAEERANQRRVGKSPYEPPRLDARARDDDEWNREWVTVVLDESNEVRSVRVVPDFNAARSVVGLDAHPALPKWQANTVPWVQRNEVLDPEERQLWRRYERGLRVVQVGDATRPLASGEYFDYQGTRAVVEQLVDEYGGDTVRTAITADSVEDQLERIMANAGVHDPETMHYGEEKSRNDFADEDVGFVLGSIDPGDDHVLDLIAELDLEAEPERSDPDAIDDPTNAECDHCDGDGCQECLGTGLKRAQGRDFVGEDAETAAEILASVRENHTAQAAGRYARNPEDPSSTATVFVRTDAMPPGFADIQVPGVAWTYSDKQERIVEVLREADRQLTAREIGSRTDVSKRHVQRTLKRLVEHDVVDALDGRGPNGATLYSDAGVPTSGVVDVRGEDGEVATGVVLGSYTWAVAVDAPTTGDEGGDTADRAGTGERPTIWPSDRTHATGDPPD